MKEKYLTQRWNDTFLIVILIANVVLIVLVLVGLVDGGFKAFTALVVIGGVGLGVGEWHGAVRFVRIGWGIKKRIKHPLTIAGMILGILSLILIIFTYYGRNLGFLTGYENAFVALAVLLFLLIGLNLRRNAVLTA